VAPPLAVSVSLFVLASSVKSTSIGIIDLFLHGTQLTLEIEIAKLELKNKAITTEKVT
jgi:hypothetical protein